MRQASRRSRRRGDRTAIPSLWAEKYWHTQLLMSKNTFAHLCAERKYIWCNKNCLLDVGNETKDTTPTTPQTGRHTNHNRTRKRTVKPSIRSAPVRRSRGKGADNVGLGHSKWMNRWHSSSLCIMTKESTRVLLPAAPAYCVCAFLVIVQAIAGHRSREAHTRCRPRRACTTPVSVSFDRESAQ